MTTLTPSRPAAVDVGALQTLLLGRWAPLRRETRELIAEHPELHKVDGLTMAEHRERVLGQLRWLAEHGDVRRAFPAEGGGSSDFGGFLARARMAVINLDDEEAARLVTRAPAALTYAIEANADIGAEGIGLAP
ncbi:MAG TPA: hypothetical protein PKB06_04185, partial [Actinotalea sp.]|nr:hypothetical protein [Actinotalea sp.]